MDAVFVDIVITSGDKLLKSVNNTRAERFIPARKVLNSASKALTLFSEGSPVVRYPSAHFGEAHCLGNPLGHSLRWSLGVQDFACRPPYVHF